jgi:uncharacterized protein YqeY
MIHQKLREEMKDAMRAKDETRLMVIRGLLALATSELINKKSNAEFLDDEGMIALIKRSVKQRKDSIDQFMKGNRADLAEGEKKELVILEKYLPETMSREEINKIATAKKVELGITDKTKIGQFTGILMKELKGKADGADVKAVVDELFK